MENLKSNYKLPKWEELPDLELYMDQVIVLINKFFSELGTSPLTPSMVNNYVKVKAVPAPLKKRYNKVHLVYLIMICSLKYTLSIQQIQQIIPLCESENDVKTIYNVFLTNYSKVQNFMSEKFEFLNDNSFDSAVQGAIASGIIKLITEEKVKKFAK